LSAKAKKGLEYDIQIIGKSEVTILIVGRKERIEH